MTKEIPLTPERTKLRNALMEKRYKSLDDPATIATVKDHVHRLTVAGNTDLAIGLFHMIVTHRTRAKQDGALQILDLQLGEPDDQGFYPVSKVRGDVLATSVGALLEAYQEGGRLLNKDHTRELVTRAVSLVYPYLPGDELTQRAFIEKAKAAHVLPESIDTIEEAIADKAARQKFFRLINDHPTMTTSALATGLGIASYVAYNYLKRFKGEGILPAERESEIRAERVKKSIVYVSSALKDFALRSKPEVVAQTESTNSDLHEIVGEKEVPTVIFERSRHGKLSLKASDIFARREVFLRYLLEHDQVPVHAVARMLGLSRIAGYKYYNALKNEGRIPVDKLRKSGRRKKQINE